MKKTERGVREALLLASLFAVRFDVFLDAIYEIEEGVLMCGYGDKDAFHLAFRLLAVPFRMPRLPSVLLDSSRSYVGLLQLDNASLPLFVHGAGRRNEPQSFS